MAFQLMPSSGKLLAQFHHSRRRFDLHSVTGTQFTPDSNTLQVMHAFAETRKSVNVPIEITGQFNLAQ
jgi:hypothetical protein